MLSIETALNLPPASTVNTKFPNQPVYYPSPADWRSEVLYFLLPDRFSDGRESERPLLDRANLWNARPATRGYMELAQLGRIWGPPLAGRDVERNPVKAGLFKRIRYYDHLDRFLNNRVMKVRITGTEFKISSMLTRVSGRAAIWLN